MDHYLALKDHRCVVLTCHSFILFTDITKLVPYDTGRLPLHLNISLSEILSVFRGKWRTLLLGSDCESIRTKT